MFFVSQKPLQMSQNIVLQRLKKRLNVIQSLHGQSFYVKMKDPKSKAEKIFVTPLFIALVMIEIIDLIFAVTAFLQFSQLRKILILSTQAIFLQF